MKTNLLNAVSKIRYLALLMFLTLITTNAWGATASLTNAEIKAATAGNSYTNRSVTSSSGTWSGKMIINTSTGYVQINKNKNNYYLGSPTFGGAISQVVIETNNNTASGRTFYLKADTKTAQPSSGDYGSGSTSSSNGTVTISVTGSPTSFFIYSNGAAYIKSVTVTYSGSSGYDITYHCNGATSGCPSNASSQTALPSPLPTPTRTGCTFAGWYTNEGLTSAATAGATLSANADLYAKWTTNVTLNRNGVVDNSHTGVTIGTTLASIQGAGAQGGCSAWTFVGWSKTQRAAQNNSNAMDLVTTIDGPGPYYAVYSHTESGGGSSTASSNNISSTSTSAVTLETGKPITYTCSASNTYSNPARIYSGNSITIEGGTITSITLTGVSSYPVSRMSASTGTLSSSGNNGTWEGSATSVTFTADDGQTRISAISVTYSGGSTTYYSTTASCCNPLGAINGSINLTNSNGDIVANGWSATSGGNETGYLVKLYNSDKSSVVASGNTGSKATKTYTFNSPADGTYWVSVTPTYSGGGSYCSEGTETFSASSITITSACSAPTFSLSTSTTYNNSQTTTITTATGGATIRYTTNGTNPTCSTGSTYSSAITVDGNQTVKAIACKAGLDASAVASATYSFKCATPTFSVAAGTYSSTQSVTLNSATTSAVIHYTTDGSTPTASSPTYSAPINVSADMTIKAIAVKANYANSDVAEAAYRIMDCDWYESFDNANGSGGNDDIWSGSIGTSSFTPDQTGWTFSSNNCGAKNCIKLGTSSAGGSAQTPTLTGLTGTLKLTFRAAGWNGESPTISIVSTSGTPSPASVSVTSKTWNDYEVIISDVTTAPKITISSSGGYSRFFLDEVCIKEMPSFYTVTFNANGHGTAPSAIENVAKNAIINSSKPADPTATGWTFGGWYKEEGCTNAWNWATDQVTENTTLYAKWTCSAPTSLSIAATGNKWDYCTGESMTLTVSGSNIGDGATYQWKLGDTNITGATSASYTTTMDAAKAGKYTCTVSNGTCSTTTSDYWVRVWTLYINNGAAGAWQELNFTNTGSNTGSNTAVELSAGGSYQFKLKDNNGGWFGLNSKTITGTESNIALNGTGANVNLTAGLGGNYTFTINYSDKNSPKVSVTYPTANQPANNVVYFDKSVITGWTTAGTTDMYLRIGKSSHNNNTKAFTLVPGTDRFYQVNTIAYEGFEAWQIANNASWSGSNSIYKVDGSGYAITKATTFQKYVVGSAGVTLVPTSSKNTENGCNYWNVDKYDGMLKHTATITAPTNGTISLAYTSKAGSPSTATVSDLPHRSYITATATPAAGYQLTTFTVTPEGGAATSLVATNGNANNHVLATNATFAATFSAKTITITWNGNGGTPSKASDTWVYNSSALASLPTASGNGSKIFAGWFTDPTAGTQIDNVGGSNKPTDNVTYYAHWSDGNTVYFNASPGTASVASVTQTTIGGTVTLATATIDCEGWSFAGWKVGSAQAETTSEPAGLLAGGASYTPESATVQMYAVWKKTADEVTEITKTYSWDGTTNTDWTIDPNNITRITSTGIYKNSGQFTGAHSFTFDNKVKVKSVSFKFLRSSNNTTGSLWICKSTTNTAGSWDDTNVCGVRDFSLPSTKDEFQLYSSEAGDFDGNTAYYVRIEYQTSSSATRYIDDISVTYNDVASVTTWTSTPDGCTPPNQVKTPVITPATEAQTGDVSVSITCATDGATIKYTTDGTTPSSSNGTTYSAPFTVSCSSTVKAIAYKATMDDSEIASQAYTITVPTPTFSLAEGTYYDANQTLMLSLPTTHTGTVIKYTTNGDDPTSSSTTYSSALTLTEGSHTIKAIGYNATCGTSSAVATATYNIRFGETYTLVTNVEDLNPGDKIVFVSADATTSTHHAISTTISSNKRASTTDFNLAAGLATATVYPAVGAAATVQVFTLGGEPGAWTFHDATNNGYLNCPSDGKLTNTVALSNSNRWNISIASNVATVANNEITTSIIKSNTGSNHIFAAYASEQNMQLVKLYSLPNPEPLIKTSATLSAFSACHGIASDAQSFYISGKNLDGNLVISGPAGYEFCLTENGTYTATLTLTPTTKTVAKTQVYVRLSASATAGAHNGNLNAAVSANSLSQNIAVTGTVSVADTYTDQIHGQVIANQCSTYYAPSCSDTSAPGAATDCTTTHYRFMGWITEADRNASGVKDDAWYIAHLITAGTSMTADGTNYYAVWAKEED